MELTQELIDHMRAVFEHYAESSDGKALENAKPNDQALEVVGCLQTSLSCMYMHDHIAEADLCECHN